MNRIFFNGVSKFSYDGQLISFSLDDTKPDPQLGTTKDVVFTGICDLRTLKGIVEFLNSQVQEVEKREGNLAGKQRPTDEKEISNEAASLMVIKATDIENHD